MSPNPVSKRIRRMLKKAFQDEHFDSKLVDEACKAKDSGLGNESLMKLAGFPKFLELLQEWMDQTEVRLNFAHRNISLSSEELNALNDRVLDLNKNFRQLLNSLGEGYLVFDQDGIAQPIYSKVCEEIFSVVPSGLSFMDLLKIEEDRREMTQDWLSLIFSDQSEFTGLADLGPSQFVTTTGSIYAISYYPMRSEKGEIQNLIVVMTDQTERIKMSEAHQEESSRAKRLLNIITHKNDFFFLHSFIANSVEKLRELYNIDQNEFQRLAQDLHTAKGLGASLDLDTVVDAIHDAELFMRHKAVSNEPNQTHLDNLAQQVLSSFEQYLDEYQQWFGSLESPRHMREYSQLSVVQFYDHLTKANCPQPTKELFFLNFVSEDLRGILLSYQQTIDSVASKLGKGVDYSVTCPEVRVCREHFQSLFLALIHCFRNSVYHGIEERSERIDKGKPARGKIHLSAEIKKSPKQNDLILVIRDDGRGIAQETHESHSHTDRAEIGPTSSTANKIAGMRVGVSAVASAVMELGGSMDIQSEPNNYYEIRLRVPAPEDRIKEVVMSPAMRASS